MTSWPSKTTLQLKNHHVGSHFTTSERSGSSILSMKHNFLSRPLSFLIWTTAMLFCLDFQHVQSNHYKWSRTQQPDCSSMNPREPMSHSLYAGFRLWLASISRLWLQDSHRLCTLLPPLSYKSTCTPGACEVSEGHFVVPSQKGTGTALLVEWSSQPYPDSRISDKVQETDENSFFLWALHCILQGKFHYICSHYSLIPLCSTLHYSEQCLNFCIAGTSHCLLRLIACCISSFVSRVE